MFDEIFNRTKGNPPQKGDFLISEPFLADPYFKRAVILLSEHNEEGSVGFIINKTTNLKVHEAIPDFPQFDALLHFGGPVNTDRLHYVHRLGKKLPGSQLIARGLYWGGDFKVLKDLIESKKVGENDIRFFVGYAGWEPTQLKTEIEDHSWIVSNYSNQGVTFTADVSNLWKKVLRDMGTEFAVLAGFPEDPSLN